MAGHLCSQSLGLARRLHLLVRPASVTLLGLKHDHTGVDAQNKITPHSKQLPASETRSALTPVNGINHGFAAEGMSHIRTFGTFGTKLASAEDSGDGDAVSVKVTPYERFMRRQNEQHQKPRRREKEENAVTAKLLQCLRKWPPDVNLEEKLGRGDVGGKEILNRTLKAVLSELTNEHTPPEDWLQDGVQGDGDPVGNCSKEDALRALNVFKWRQKTEDVESQTFSDSSLESLLHPVLQALKGAGLKDELRAFWTEYKGLAQDTPTVLGTFQHAFSRAGMFDEVVAIFEEARSMGWPLSPTAASLGIQALQAKGASRDELWEFHKTWFEESRCALNHARAFMALLESGITVSELRSLEYTNEDAFRSRMIMALSLLGRTAEAREIVLEFLDPETQKALHLSIFLLVLRTFIRFGYVAEAQQLVFEQHKHGNNLNGAFVHMFRGAVNVVPILETYKTLEVLDGPHKTSRAVQGLLISHIYSKLASATENMYQTYLNGRRLYGWYKAEVFATVIKRLASEDRAAEAEGVLADYYKERQWERRVEPLDSYALHSLGNMYLRADMTHKLVNMVKELLNHNLFIADTVIKHWANVVSKMKRASEARELLDAQAEMERRRSAKWMGRSDGADWSKPRDRKPVKWTEA